MNGKQLDMKAKSALIDSGTSLIVLPDEDFEELLHQLRSSYNLFCQFMGMQIQCSCANGDLTVFPDIKLSFSNANNTFTLKPSDYITI